MIIDISELKGNDVTTVADVDTVNEIAKLSAQVALLSREFIDMRSDVRSVLALLTQATSSAAMAGGHASLQTTPINQQAPPTAVQTTPPVRPGIMKRQPNHQFSLDSNTPKSALVNFSANRSLTCPTNPCNGNNNKKAVNFSVPTRCRSQSPPGIASERKHQRHQQQQQQQQQQLQQQQLQQQQQQQQQHLQPQNQCSTPRRSSLSTDL